MKAWKHFKAIRGFYSPRLSNKQGVAIKGTMENLPIVKPEAFNNLIGFKAHSSSEDRGFVFHSSIAAFFVRESGMFYIRFDLPQGYSAPESLVEITATEYDKIYMVTK